MVVRFAIRYGLVPLALLIAVTSTALAAVDARVDRSNIAVGETFTLVIAHPITSNSGQFNLSIRPPSHRPLLQDFDVLGRNNSNQLISQNKASIEWIFTLRAKKAGAVTIPALEIDGQSSPEIPLNIKPARNYKAEPNQPMFAHTEVDEPNPYVQQQTIYTVKVFLSGEMGMSNYDMGQPEGPFVVQPFSKESRYRTEINGKAYDVVERRWALFPQQSGTLAITAPEFIAEFGGPSLFSRRSQKRLVVGDSTLDVRPQPNDFKGALWLPAKGLNISANISPPADKTAGYQTGEPITYNLTVTALGLTSAQLPTPVAPQLKGSRVYPEDPVDEQGERAESIIGRRQRRVAIVPSTAGELTLPAIETSWWNTETNRQETARIEPLSIQINAAPAAPAEAISANSNQAPAAAPAAPRSWMENRLWFFATVALLLAALALLIRRWLQRRRDMEQQWLNRDNSKETQTMGLSARWHSLRNALQGTGLSNRSSSEAAAKALASWSQARWPEAGAHSAVAIAERLDPQRQMPELHRELGFIDQCRYGREGDSAQWHGKQAWKALEAAVEATPASTKKANAGLPELYA